MADNPNALLGSIYTLTPTHCGTGQTTGAIDLPIARESTTGLPILPASMIKGVTRDTCEVVLGEKHANVKSWFGPKTSEPKLEAGSLIFTEGRLLALPVRSLNRSFLYATSPLLLDRLDRDMRLFGFNGLPISGSVPAPSKTQIQVADDDLVGQSVVIEDLAYAASEIATLPQVKEIAQFMANLLPETEKATRARLARNLIVLSDEDMIYLCENSIPVNARVKLTKGKTTDSYKDENGELESGNLWYEETLPADCLFAFFVVERRNATASGSRPATSNQANSLREFEQAIKSQQHIQMGGHETVGQGQCWWTFLNPLTLS